MNTEYDYIQQVKEYETRKLWVWDRLLLCAIGIALLMLLLAFASVGAQAGDAQLIMPRERNDTPSLSDVLRPTVLITVVSRGTAPCPPPKPRLVKLSHGSYELEQSMTIHAIACWSNTSWQEEWTALPEADGQFIRRVK